MKITKKILQDIIKEETAKVLNRKLITEIGVGAIIPYLATGLKAVGVGIAGEAVYSRLASALGLDEDNSAELEKLLDRREEQLYEYIMRQTNRSLKKANDIIESQNIRIKELEEVVENFEFNKSIDTERSIALK